MIPVLPRGVRVKEDSLRKTHVLLGPERALMLDPIGAAILAELDGVSTQEQISARLSARFGAPKAQVARDVDTFLTGLSERRLLEMRAP